MRRTHTGVLALALAVALVAPGVASATSLGELYHAYSKTGALDPCKYSSADLENALNSIPTDVQQYDPRFAAALKDALAYRNSGGCKPHHSSSGSTGTPSAPIGGSGDSGGSAGGLGTPTASDGAPKPPQAPARVHGKLTAETAPVDFDSHHGFPVALGILAGTVGAALAGAGLLAASRRFGWGMPGFLGPGRAKLVD